MSDNEDQEGDATSVNIATVELTVELARFSLPLDEALDFDKGK
ncbi:MAG: hypothetical protein R3A47_02030 [Polyangiales bacterium]